MFHFNKDPEFLPDMEKIGNLAYGTPLRYQGSRYIKIDKKKRGQGIGLSYPREHSIIVNIKLGTLRALPGDTIVQVLDINASERPGKAVEHLKYYEV